MITKPWQRLRQVIQRLRPRLDPVSVGRTAVAAAVAWIVARALTGAVDPYLAPVAAILCLQVTVAQSLGRSLERSAAVVAGLWLAVAFSHGTGISAWSVGLLTALGVALGQLLRLGSTGIAQVAVTALLVLAIHRRQYAWARGVDTLVGAAVAVAVTAAFSPPRHVRQARLLSHKAAAALALRLQALAHALRRGLPRPLVRRQLIRARALERRLRAAETGLQQAQAELRWNWMASRQRRHLRQLELWVPLLGRAVAQARGVARSLERVSAAEASHPGPLSEVVAQALQALAAAWQGWAEGHRGSALALCCRRAEQAVQTAWSIWREHPAPSQEWVAILVDLEKMVEDVLVGAHGRLT